MHSKSISLIDTLSGGATAPSLTEKAYVVIRDRIIKLDLPPGTPIQEESLAKSLGFGRTPVREALIRLGQEGLVTVLPRRGTFVSDINITDLAQIAEVRVQLEGFAAGLAAQRVNQVERQAADALLESFEQSQTDKSQERLIDFDQHVHYFVYRCTKNRFLEESLVRYFNVSLRMWYLVLDRVVHLHDAVNEHIELLHAIQRGEVARAQEIAAQHVRNFEAEIRKVI